MGPEQKPFVGSSSEHYSYTQKWHKILYCLEWKFLQAMWYCTDMSLDKNTAAVYLLLFCQLPLKIKLKSFLKFQGHCNTKIGDQMGKLFFYVHCLLDIVWRRLLIFSWASVSIPLDHDGHFIQGLLSRRYSLQDLCLNDLGDTWSPGTFQHFEARKLSALS